MRRRRFWAVLAASMTVVLVGATGVIGLPVSPVGSPGAANNLSQASTASETTPVRVAAASPRSPMASGDPGSAAASGAPSGSPGSAAPRNTSTATGGTAPAPTAVVEALLPSLDRWVAVTGSDSASGSASQPWRTIQHAVDRTPAGGVITVHAGTYAHFTVNRSGLVIEGAAGEVVTVSGGMYVVLVEGVSSATIRHLTIQNAPDQWGSGIRIEASRAVLVEGNLVQNNHSFGIKVKDATNVRIASNEIRGNDTGIELSGSVGGTAVVANRIHDNNRMVTSSRGGNGIVFTKTTGPITVNGNKLWANRARHLSGSGYDGGAFEVYGSSDLRITDNTMWNNNNVMETGTDGTAPCSRITFTRNVAYGPGTVPNNTQGLILRCAASSLFANNTFDGLDTFAFYVATSGSYAGSIGDLRIENNIVVRGRSYSIGTGVPSTVVIDYNLALPGGSSAEYADHLAFVEGRGNTDSLAEFRAWTGYDKHGRLANPRFVNLAARDYRLQAGSPAIDAGVSLGGTYVGTAPDMGRFEWGT